MPILRTVDAKCDICEVGITTSNMDVFSGGLYEIKIRNNVKRIDKDIVMCNECYRTVFMKAIKDATIARSEQLKSADEGSSSPETQPDSESS